MKRYGNIYSDMCSLENLYLADKKARKGKKDQKGIMEFDLNREANILHLQDRLVSKTYTTSPYKVFYINDPKPREIRMLPYTDRIAQHAAMNYLEPIFVSTFTADTYSCIKGRGIHKALRGVKKALRDEPNTKYCLKLDIRKFYENIDHDILKQLLRRKIKDENLLWFLDNVIDSAPGVPIGNYLSQYFANFYLTFFDHWLKENKKVKYYFRYSDDMAFLHGDKAYLHQLLADIREYLATELKLKLKGNYQIFPVDVRGIDFVGYVIYRTHVRMRKSIKKNYARAVRYGFIKSLPSYGGWASHCNSGNLKRKLAA